MAAMAEILGSICIGFWSYFTEKYEKHLNKKGIRIIRWNII
ncbi:hypothetical protein ACFOU2_11270 [Bacillus songklensis]|uniref:Uncharacterized protein n=1 Tax=Bacillus songklensis TaxID=1069116 RepID=A0ABV8B159_9BACI